MTVPHANTQALTHDLVDQTYTLAREANHALTLEEWRRFAIPLAAEQPTQMRAPGVILVLRNDLIRGMAAFCWKRVPDGSRLLSAQRIVIMDRARKELVSQELLAGLIEVAVRDNCTRVRAELPRSSTWLENRWSDPDGGIFRLPVECIRIPPDESEAASDDTVVTLHVPTS